MTAPVRSPELWARTLDECAAFVRWLSAILTGVSLTLFFTHPGWVQIGTAAAALLGWPAEKALIRHAQLVRDGAR